MAAAKEYTEEWLNKLMATSQEALALLRSKDPVRVAAGMDLLKKNLENYNGAAQGLSKQTKLSLLSVAQLQVQQSMALTSGQLDATDPVKVADVISRLEQLQRCAQYCLSPPSRGKTAIEPSSSNITQYRFNEMLAHAGIGDTPHQKQLVQLNAIAKKPASTAAELETKLRDLEALKQEVTDKRNELLQAKVDATHIRISLSWAQAQNNEQYYTELLTAIEQPPFSTAAFLDFTTKYTNLWQGVGSDVNAVIAALQKNPPMPLPELKALVQCELANQKVAIDEAMRREESPVQWVENERILGKIDQAIYDTQQKLRLGNAAAPYLARREEMLTNAKFEWRGTSTEIAEVEKALATYNQHKALNDALKRWRNQNPMYSANGISNMASLSNDIKVTISDTDLAALTAERDRLGRDMSIKELSDFLQKQEDASFNAVSKLIADGKIGPELAEQWKDNEKEIEHYSKIKNFEAAEKKLLAEREDFLNKLLADVYAKGHDSMGHELLGMNLQLEKNESALAAVLSANTTKTYTIATIHQLMGNSSLIANGPLATKLAELQGPPEQTISREDLIKILKKDQEFILAKINGLITGADQAVISAQKKYEWFKMNKDLKLNSEKMQRLKDDHDTPAELKISHTDFKAVMAVLNDNSSLPADTAYTPVDKDDIYKGGTLEPKPGTGSYTAKFEKDGNVKITGKDAHTKGVDAVLTVFRKANIKAVDIDCPKTAGKVNEDKMLSVIQATLKKDIAPVMKKDGKIIPANETLEFILTKAKTDPRYTPVAQAYATAIMNSGDTALMAQLTHNLTAKQKSALEAMPPSKRGKAIVSAVIQHSVDSAPNEPSAVKRLFGNPSPGLRPAGGGKSMAEHIMGVPKEEADPTAVHHRPLTPGPS